VRAATVQLVPIWSKGGCCTRVMAQAISDKILRTQTRNDKARRSAKKTTIRRLHALGIWLKKIKRCTWSRW